MNGLGVIDFYQRNEGVGEPCGVNCNWITDWMWGFRASWLAWCAATVSRALVEAGFSDDGDTLNLESKYGINQDTAKGWGYVPALCSAFVQADRFTDNPAWAPVGAPVIFNYSGDWRDPTYGTPGDHTGVLLQDLGDGTCMVWEGNDRNNSIGLWRRPMDQIYGFCVPPFEELVVPEDFTDEDLAVLADS